MAGPLGVDTHTLEIKNIHASEDYFQKPIIIASGEGILERGAILQQNSGTFEYEELNPAAGANAIAILESDVDATSEAVTVDATMIGKMVHRNLLWPATIVAAQQNAALVALRNVGIIMDDTVIYS